MPDHNYHKDLDVAKEAAHKAAEKIREFQDSRDFDIGLKAKNDLVTDADVAVEKIILSILKDAFPDDDIMAEETAGGKGLTDSRTWIVDPIDGTTNFTHGFPIFCVSIGLWQDSVPKVGVVLEVNSKELFWAVEGRGAFLNGEKITVSQTEELAQSLIGTGFPYYDLSLIKNYLKLFEWLIEHTRALRRPGAASFDLCCVASGRFDGFYEYSLNPWDVGAAALIVMEAGGAISDWDGNEDWLFGKRIIAANPAIHNLLLQAVHTFFPAGERAPDY